MEKAAKEVAKAISIHSLRMEGDCSIDQRSHAVIHFNPLPPHGGRRSKSSIADLASYFNPLPPHGGRRYPCRKNKSGEHFNPLPPHGGRPHFAGFVIVTLDISIHSLRMEGDKNGYPQKKHISSFQSTPSAWRETGAMHRIERLYYISIHSLRMEGDDNGMIGYFSGMHFNPLPPYGGRQIFNQP